MASDLETFIQLAKSCDFRNRDELLLGLETGDIVLRYFKTNVVYTARHYLEIHRRRSKHLARFGTQHSQRMLNDVNELVQRLQSNPKEEIRTWGFTQAANVDYTAFEGTKSKSILGCVFGKDKRFTSPEEWARLWRAEGQEP